MQLKRFLQYKIISYGSAAGIIILFLVWLFVIPNTPIAILVWPGMIILAFISSWAFKKSERWSEVGITRYHKRRKPKIKKHMLILLPKTRSRKHEKHRRRQR